jgi:rfaE bifunctional protein kinase chain/domain/rfaE bifunctional protein nucleotidyltransferase chain/domain
MEQIIKNKILLLDELIEKVDALQLQGKTVVQTHGVFDLIHPGIIKHLNEAKKRGDIMIVTVIKDKDVRKGPERPIFPEDYRLENVSSLEQVDYCCLVDDDTPFECVKKIKPDCFAKGSKYAERDRSIHSKIFDKERELVFGKSIIHETEGFSFSSSHIINNLLDIYSEETRNFLKGFSRKYSFHNIIKSLDDLKNLKVLLIGDGIIDEYYYCESMGKSPKSQLIVNKYVTHEVFAGGAFAIANHVAGICDKVQLVTMLGREDTREDFTLKNLKPNVGVKFFYRDDGPSVVKRRYISQHHNEKIFEINNINDNNISGKSESEIIDYLKSVIHEYDLILVSDFGHGFITDELIRNIESFPIKLAVNAQTNGANSGYNLITKYKNTNFICLDAPEARLATQEKYAEIDYVARKLLNDIDTDYLIITVGGDGSLCINREGEINRTPAFATKVVDVIGAGDAFFSLSSLCFAMGMPMDLVSFIGNAVGALAVQIVGNKRSVEGYEIKEFIHSLINRKSNE